jgi:ribonuclease P protein component
MTRRLPFTRAMRLVRKEDFAETFRTGRRARGNTLAVVVRANGLEHTRLGLSVGRVVWKSAVKRNRVRRIFREAFRLAYPELPRGLDVILIPAAAKLEPELATTRGELVSLVQRAASAIARSGVTSSTRSQVTNTAGEATNTRSESSSARNEATRAPSEATRAPSEATSIRSEATVTPSDATNTRREATNLHSGAMHTGPASSDAAPNARSTAR